jgi:hypothetical protein
MNCLIKRFLLIDATQKRIFVFFRDWKSSSLKSNEKGKYETKTKQQTRKGQKGIKYYIKSPKKIVCL